jgi:hypothetical protein
VIQNKNAYRVLLGKHEGKNTTRKTKLGCGSNIKTDLSEIAWEDVTWVHFA